VQLQVDGSGLTIGHVEELDYVCALAAKDKERTGAVSLGTRPLDDAFKLSL